MPYLELRRQLVEGHRKYHRVHLLPQDDLEVDVSLLGAPDAHLVLASEKRSEERQPLDVIPVGVADQEVHVDPDADAAFATLAAAGGAIAGRQELAQWANPGARVQHHQPIRASLTLNRNARCIATVTRSRGTRGGNRTPSPPKSYPIPHSP